MAGRTLTQINGWSEDQSSADERRRNVRVIPPNFSIRLSHFRKPTGG